MLKRKSKTFLNLKNTEGDPIDSNKIKRFLQELKVNTFSFFKAQLILSFTAFIILSVGLYWIGVDLWGLKAFLIALMDFVPVLGSGLIMIPWAIIKGLSGSAEVGARIAILYIVLVIARFILEPILVGKSIKLSPLLVLVITLLSTLVLGPIGAIVGGFISIVVKVGWQVFFDKNQRENHNRIEKN